MSSKSVSTPDLRKKKHEKKTPPLTRARLRKLLSTENNNTKTVEVLSESDSSVFTDAENSDSDDKVSSDKSENSGKSVKTLRKMSEAQTSEELRKQMEQKKKEKDERLQRRKAAEEKKQQELKQKWEEKEKILREKLEAELEITKVKIMNDTYESELSEESDTSSEEDPRERKKRQKKQKAAYEKIQHAKVINSLCSAQLIQFKSGNVRNFLSSVRTVYETVRGDKCAENMVLDYAKTRVDNNVVISQKNYDSFEQFKNDVMGQFKPA